MEGASTSLATIAERNSIDEITTEGSNAEPETKVIKLSEKNLDPLEYFSRFLGIPEMILQHLNLVKISEVSPSFYNVIASSKVFMEKIKIVFYEDSVWTLKNSSRLYQNVEVRRKFQGGSSLTEESFFTARKRHFYSFLTSIESSVESLACTRKNELSILFYDSSLNFESFNVLTFPKLKQMKFHLEDDSSLTVAYAIFFINAIAVEELDLKVGTKIVEDGTLTKLLENFDKLTSLKLRSVKISEMFKDESWKRFIFKLKSLTINFQGDDGTNFRNFLKSRSDYLEEIIIDARFVKTLFDVVMKMPKLRSLCIPFCWNLSENEVPDKVSTSITELKVDGFIDSEDLKFLLNSMPNVRRLSIYLINQFNFPTLLALGRKFEELSYCELRGIDPEELTEISDKTSLQPESFFYLRNFQIL